MFKVSDQNVQKFTVGFELAMADIGLQQPAKEGQKVLAAFCVTYLYGDKKVIDSNQPRVAWNLKISCDEKLCYFLYDTVRCGQEG